MAKIEDLINEIPDAKIRQQLASEVAALKKQKKFGLVFEDHIPEIVQLPGLPVKIGFRAVKRGGSSKDLFVVRELLGSGKARISPENQEGESEIVKVKELVVVKKFGEAIYPALVPVAVLTRAEGKPYHTLINADNYHALQLLEYCYAGKVDVIYIDPPYNTGARDWKYNNDYVDRNDQFRHSKWLSMMKKRLSIAKTVLKPNGVMIVTIDDYELYHLGCLLEELFPAHDQFIVTIEHNKRGRRGKNFAKSNEWALYLVPHNQDVIQEEQMGSLIGGEQRNLRRTGSGSKREERWRKFFPIWVEEKTLKVVSAGDPIPKDAKWKVERRNGLLTVWPVDEEGREKNWHYGVERTRSCIEAGTLEARPQHYGIQVYFTLREKESKKYKTVWSKPIYDASTYGSELLDEILAGGADFEYPKSVYAVAECLRAACGHKPDALILDFFAGSGTTYHATCLLNAESGAKGKRRCILVTNNEVRESTSKHLNKQGLFPGEGEFEAHGICESVTWPRCQHVTAGKRFDGTPLQGKYISGRAMSLGFEENIEYFRIDFIDPHEVAYGDKFEAVLPILWLMAGALGKRGCARGYGKFLLPKNSPYAVLIKEEAFGEFKRVLVERPDVKLVFIVTDSEEAYREMSLALPGKPRTKMLYKSYLDNFKINTEKSL